MSTAALKDSLASKVQPNKMVWTYKFVVADTYTAWRIKRVFVFPLVNSLFLCKDLEQCNSGVVWYMVAEMSGQLNQSSTCCPVGSVERSCFSPAPSSCLLFSKANILRDKQWTGTTQDCCRISSDLSWAQHLSTLYLVLERKLSLCFFATTGNNVDYY